MSRKPPPPPPPHLLGVDVVHLQMSWFTISGHLAWSTQILVTCCKSYCLIGFLCRNLRDVSRRCIEYLYMTIVRPVLVYCNFVWALHQDKYVSKLEGGSNICNKTRHQAVACWLRLVAENPALATSLCSLRVSQIMPVQMNPLWTITNFIIFLYSSPLSYCRLANSCPRFQSYVNL